MTFFLNDRTIRQATAAPAAGSPTDFAENISAQYDSAMLMGRTNGNLMALHEVYDRYIEDLGDDGRDLGNPVALEAAPGVAAFSTIDRAEEIFRQRLEAKGITPRAGEELREEAKALAAQRISDADDVAKRATSLGAFGGFVGQTGAMITDPPLLGSMLLGAPVGAGILRTAATEALIATTTEIAIQPMIAASRAELGQELTFDEAVDNVLLAAFGGAIFGGTFRGVGVLAEKTRAAIQAAARDIDIELPNTAEVRDAQAFVGRFEDMRQASPFSEQDLAGPAEHVKRFDEALRAGREGRPANMPVDAPTPVRRDVLDATPPPRPPGRVGGLGAALRELAMGERRATDNALRPLERARITAQVSGLGQAKARLDEIEAMLRRPDVRPKVTRLATFLQRNGGLRDEGAELTKGLGLSSKDRPGLINNKGGRSLDDAALAAQEAGFFPGRDLEAGDRITPDDLLGALGDDLSGRPRIREADEADAALLQELQDLERELDQRGIALDDIPRGQLDNVLRETPRGVDQLSGAATQGERARAEFERLELETDDFDRAVEASVLREIEGQEEGIFIDLDDGGAPVSARQMLDDIAEDESAVAELSDCILAGSANVG